MNRRDFLLLRPGRSASVMELSCERLLIKYLDAKADGTVAALFERLRGELRSVRGVRLTDTSWLGRDDFRAALGAVLDDFCAGGGRLQPPLPVGNAS